MDRDAHVYDSRNARDVRDVLPRLSDRSDAPASSRTSRALDIFANAQKLPPYSIHAQQQLLHQDQKQQQQQRSPTHSASHQASELALLPSASSTSSFQNSSSRHYFQQQQTPYNHTANGSDSQDTNSSADTSASTDTDQLFTPPISEGELSIGGGGSGSVNGSANASSYEHDFSSQESQLLQLSRLAATRERMTDVSASDVFDGGALSRKRAADGSVKLTRNASSTSPVYMGGHSRNTSTVSVASTAGSRIGELSAELKTRLSYAMVKVNNGWQSHSIDQVENLASHGASPASSTSTIHGRHGSSLSPRIPGHSFHNRHQSQTSVSTTSTTIAPTGRTPSALDMSSWSSQQGSRSAHSTPPLPSPLSSSRTGSAAPTRSLAPPASIQPSRSSALSRRNSNPGYHPPALPTSYSQGSPHTPGDFEAGHRRTPTADPILFTPHQNVREQDAIETLLFMSSPGNSSNMKQFPSITSSSQPLPAGHHDPQHASMNSPQRHALPGSVPRKSLPSGRPNAYGLQPPLGRRGAHNRSPSEMDIDEPYSTPYSRSSKGTPKRRANGLDHVAEIASPRMKMPLSMPSGLSGTSKPRPVLGEDDIERMLDRAAAASADDSSDSESEILIPSRRTNHVGI
ncbi:hypothetical protein SEUCBS140593_002831 [Sporothrix eucalyptigena]|uniref:Cyclin-dependent kinase n=1 Tax=Sporothrix eucalyptigena TaxID=1812306 RepID=A0ABP0B9S9_9PEZI